MNHDSLASNQASEMVHSGITITSREPSPPRADFALYIDFVKGQGSAGRVFLAAQEFIKACESLDHTLCSLIDSSIEPVMVLEELETGSLKIWLRNVLKASDDDGLKSLDWKPLVGKYLVRAKYLVLRWIDDEAPTPRDLTALSKQLQELAAETDVKHLPEYARPKPQDLVESIGKFQAAKDALIPGDRAEFISDEGNVEININIRFGPDELTSLAVSKTISNPPMPMILAVRRPDYLGQSQWDFRHGKTPIKAKIEHVEWLKRFQNREIDVRPGDALRCQVAIDYLYGHDNELLDQKYTITTVEEVLIDRYRQTEMKL